MKAVWDKPRIVLLIGSAPDAVRAREFPAQRFAQIVTVNNAWRIRKDWSHLVHPEDFPSERRPSATVGQKIITHEEFVPANNAYGGIIYAGGTMAYTAGYWALHSLKPDVLAFIGCDMVYDDETTHFYGKGSADPLRDDPTLQDLKAKSNRLLYLAAKAGCLCVNLSEKERSELTFPRLSAEALMLDLSEFRTQEITRLLTMASKPRVNTALELEDSANCFSESGDYWNSPDRWDARQLAEIDAIWNTVFLGD